MPGRFTAFCPPTKILSSPMRTPLPADFAGFE
ncbi:MAG: hypothetical protein K0S98_378 [Propionibacteriaceae bacterium]|nr:hypothetical protein [Propionibacteriaceae bacterium]